MRFFFDRCMSFRLARMVDAFEASHTARAHDDDSRFNAQSPDTEWMATLAADDPPWVVISSDNRILRSKAERQALREANLTFFCMGRPWQRMKIHEYAWKFIRVWPEIVRHAVESVGSPAIFEVTEKKVHRLSRTRDPD
jgi:hypothetical protein